MKAMKPDNRFLLRRAVSRCGTLDLQQSRADHEAYGSGKKGRWGRVSGDEFWRSSRANRHHAGGINSRGLDGGECFGPSEKTEQQPRAGKQPEEPDRRAPLSHGCFRYRLRRGPFQGTGPKLKADGGRRIGSAWKPFQRNATANQTETAGYFRQMSPAARLPLRPALPPRPPVRCRHPGPPRAPEPAPHEDTRMKSVRMTHLHAARGKYR